MIFGQSSLTHACMGERTAETVVEEDSSETETRRVGGEETVVDRLQSVRESEVEVKSRDWEADTLGTISAVEVVDSPDEDLLAEVGLNTDTHTDKSGYGRRVAREADALYEEMGEAVGRDDEWTVEPSVVVLTIEMDSGEATTEVFDLPKTHTNCRLRELCNLLSVNPIVDSSLEGREVPLVSNGDEWIVALDADTSDSPVVTDSDADMPLSTVAMVLFNFVVGVSILTMGIRLGSPLGLVAGFVWLSAGALTWMDSIVQR